MKHVTYAEKSLLIDDGAADAIMEYARLIALHGLSDAVTLRAIGAEGHVVDATFLLTPATVLMVESADSTIAAPDNSGATAQMAERIRILSSPNRGVPEPDWEDPSSGFGED